jgi:hypothetical protein
VKSIMLLQIKRNVLIDQFNEYIIQFLIISDPLIFSLIFDLRKDQKHRNTEKIETMICLQIFN